MNFLNLMFQQVSSKEEIIPREKNFRPGHQVSLKALYWHVYCLPFAALSPYPQCVSEAWETASRRPTTLSNLSTRFRMSAIMYHLRLLSHLRTAIGLSLLPARTAQQPLRLYIPIFLKGVSFKLSGKSLLFAYLERRSNTRALQSHFPSHVLYSHVLGQIMGWAKSCSTNVC